MVRGMKRKIIPGTGNTEMKVSWKQRHKGIFWGKKVAVCSGNPEGGRGSSHKGCCRGGQGLDHGG